MFYNIISGASCLYLIIFSFVSSDFREIKIRKRDIGLQTCIQNFDVHKDKIIRTQDSKEMGAKYINEIDLGSREECLRLCCEIENCDVFVFEEKNSGSCYLFQCGPPEDFKCKFTHHANYSSAILAVNRHLPDLEKQIKLTKHEQDLTKLRNSNTRKEAETHKNQEKTTTAATTVVNEVKLPSVSTSPMPSNSEGTNGAKCSRFQFECRSTKECIAIYNACDGIPQCADGSDEAYELGCPESTTKAVTPAHQNQASVIDTEIPIMHKVELTKGKLYPQQQQQSQSYFPSSSKQRDEFQTTNIQGSEPDFVRPNSRISHPISYNNQVQQYAEIGKSQGTNWAQRTPVDIRQQYQQYEDGNRMYNYKENRIPPSEGQGFRSNYEDAKYNHKSNYYDGAYQQIPLQYEEKWIGNNQDARLQNGNQYIPDVNQNPQAWIPQSNNPDGNMGLSQESIDNWKPEIPHSHHEHEKMAHDLKHSKQLMENVGNKKPANTAKIEKFETHKDKDRIQYSKVTQYKVDVELEDGIAETPGGAVLSLTLGLIITCVMALLIGCRLRIVRRRIRRGGKSYAHDADYLVNGMYL